MQNSINLLNEATDNDLYDADYGGWMVEAVETHETIEQFIESSQKWAEATIEQYGEIAGFKFVAWAEMQSAKGQPRRTLSVVDLGDVRVALNVDLTDYE